MPKSRRFAVELLRQAENDLDALKNHRAEAVREILRLEENPELGHLLSGSLRGTRSLEFNLKGSGAYRAVYTVVDERYVCIVFIVGPHENIYKKAERRWAAVKKSI
jgi:mRNA-degrading endonuclease RelE of RelBE toxin-antitoxin system